VKPKRVKPGATARAALERCLNVADFESLARKRLSPGAYGYYAGGSEDERTLARNRDGLGRWVLLPRVLVDVGRVDVSARALGAAVAMPILVAPTAFHRLAHPDGETATARGAGAAGALMVASTIATCTLESIAEAATGPLWFQLYVYRDRSLALDLIRRAEAAGYRGLCLTVDAPRLGRRERDLVNRFTLPPRLTMANLASAGAQYARWGSRSSMFDYANSQLDPSLSWDAVSWLRKQTKLPILLKGIVRRDDAIRAVERGVEAIIVSNHGGRQLDGEEATILALPDVVEAVAGRAEVYVDGGFRRGSDVLKALALGARGVLVGRPVLWGLAAGGAPGVTRVLELLRAELELAMALAGCPSLAAIDRSLVRRA
jgi:4-hydroxymandelate oxidase